ncbi:PD-(D/E)XK nuclease family protein [Microbacterium terricola]|uniref:PD-(D/E)XK nuclease superfamily protein n=1 Tax=Microbacterium terricola TaxID=344163 RepID=A0ABM8E002_9MICO|nr:PD-(D/E)XK nuclease family protein [Microbacterium terricola]UYK40987.1 PD-(D/E)XK nuclease family protein [Microbacterium terricola]BDV31257.1 hypothetical protein Microterr_19170 [Microbacterium terricola]
MTASLIFTTEPLATRALAAEIRHDQALLVEKLAAHVGEDRLGRFADVRAEYGDQKIDIALIFSGPEFVLGIEAKFDHALTEDQVDRELTVADHLVVLLLEREHATEWLPHKERVSLMTWEEVLECFPQSRLTLTEVRAARSGKSAVEARLRQLIEPAQQRLGSDWTIDSRRGGSGMPALNFHSPMIGDAQLRAVLQVAQRAMPAAGDPVPLRFSVGVSVIADSTSYPRDASATPPWVDAVRRLRDDVIGDRVEDLHLSRRRPSSAHVNSETVNGRAHARKLAIVSHHFADSERWLTTGYIDWIVGPASQRMPLERVELLTDALVEILDRWYRVELAAFHESPQQPARPDGSAPL